MPKSSDTPAAPAPPATVAAVDLGSNSFHMVVATLVHGDLRVVDRLRERVALAEGLTPERTLQPEVAERALECLRRFGQRLRHMPSRTVRAVGTNTLRQLRDGGAFVTAATRALGHPIEVIAGREEARLIDLGVAHTAPEEAGRRLVVDVGGGSTELILGERLEPLAAESLHMGCVTYGRFFPGGAITAEAFDRAVVAALLELATIRRRFQAIGWDRCIGASGTVQAVAGILRALRFAAGEVNHKGLKRLRGMIVDAGHVRRLDLPGMAAERAPVLPGGVAILLAVFESLGLDTMHVSNGALREGVLYDLLGRIHHEDVRDRTIRIFTERYHVDLEQAGRVERTALACLAQVAAPWGLVSDEARRFLAWGARLHEIGLTVAYSGHHKHGAYLVANSDMPGFSLADQALLAALLRGQRNKVPKDLFQHVPAARVPAARKLCGILRLAVLLNRGRSPRPLPALRLTVEKDLLRIAFPPQWLAEHPLTRALLETEALQFEPLGFRLALA